jgi:uncharacterized protein (TIGR01777 family)
MKSLRVVLAGGSGFLGQGLSKRLRRLGYQPVVLTRSWERTEHGIRFVRWDGKTTGEWAKEIDGACAVVNLTGKSVMCRHTPSNKRKVVSSRVDSVRVIGEAIRAAEHPPLAWIQSGSAAIYGDAGDRPCDESAPAGTGFSPETCVAWEQAFAQAPTPPGVARVLLRMGLVLGEEGGPLQTLEHLARLGFGGPIGTGRQAISWLHAADLHRMVLWGIERGDLDGVYNACSLTPVTNAEFMSELRRVLHRRFAVPTPAWLAHLGAPIIGREAELALTGRRAVPARFRALRFPFQFPTLRAALEDLYPDDSDENGVKEAA